jgi:AraC-like DNA-binding protein
MSWQQYGCVLRQEATVCHVFGPGNVNEIEPGILRCYGIRYVKEAPLPWRIGLPPLWYPSHARLSRRVLEKRFRRKLGHSVHQEIDRVRVDEVARVLLQTQMSISEVAEAFSFADATHLSRFFRKKAGMSPSQYRKQHQF